MGRIGNYDLDKIDTEQRFNLGERLDLDGRVYRYIKFNAGDGAADATAGHLITGLDSAYDYWEGTNDNNSSAITAVLQRPIGFVQAALTDGDFGWVQTRGPNRQAILTDGSVAQGEMLMPHATTTGGVDTHDAAAKAKLGVALEADTGTALAVGQVSIEIE